MGIGTSLGAFHEDEFAHIASPWMEKPEDTPDNNVIDPDIDLGSTQPLKNPVIPISDVKDAPKTNFEQAKSDLNLTSQEQDLYRQHLTNLWGDGGVNNPPTADNPNWTRSTLRQMSMEQDGKTYNVPTVHEGKILSNDEAADKAVANGLDKYPSYASEDEAESRYSKMHDYMEKDTMDYFGVAGQ